MKRLLVFSCFVFAAFFGYGATAGAAPIYHLIDLGLTQWNSSWSNGINNSGQVTVHSKFNGQTFNYVYSGGTLTQLPLGTADPVNQGANVYGINDSGEVTGAYITASLKVRAMTYSNGVLTDIGALPTNPSSNGLAINNLGQVAGYGENSPGTSQAALFANGAVQLLSASRSEATGINNLGQVAFWSQVPNGGGTPYAFLYDGAMHNLGEGVTAGINDSGEIIGTSPETPPIAWSYSGGAMHSLGTLSGEPYSFAHGINDEGDIVGSSGPIVFDSVLHGDFGDLGFLYQGGKMYNLNNLLDSSKLHWSVIDGAAINDKGWIAGEGFFSVHDNTTGVIHPILLIPVPEPGGVILLFFGGLTAIAWMTLRRQSIRRPPRSEPARSIQHESRHAVAGQPRPDRGNFYTCRSLPRRG